MWRVSFMSGIYAVEIDNVDSAASAIQNLVETGCPTILVMDLDELIDIGVIDDISDINFA